MAPNVREVLPNPVDLGQPVSGDIVFFSPYERKGVIVMAVAGIISCTFVSILLLSIIASALSFVWRKPDSTAPFLKKQVAVFIVCLLVSDLIQSIAGVLQVKWARENRIYEGGACTTQAATLVMGDLGSTVWSTVIAAHTFSGLALGKHWSRVAVFTIVAIGWAAVLFLAVASPFVLESLERGPFYGIAGDWCFITSDYAIPRLVIHYIPLFVAAVILLVFYGLVFFVLRGSVGPFRQLSQPAGAHDTFRRERIAIAKRMLWYPIAYVTCILPIATIRLVGLKEEVIPDGVWIFGMFFLFLLGAIDTVIYTITRNMIKPFRFSRDLSNELSTMRTTGGYTPDPSSRKLAFSGVGGADVHSALNIDWDEDHVKIKDNGHREQKTQPSVTKVHVTFERIEEVI